MRDLRPTRIIVTIVALVSLIVVFIIAMTGMKTMMTDGMLLAMKVIGGISIAAFVANMILTLAQIVQHRKG